MISIWATRFPIHPQARHFPPWSCPLESLSCPRLLFLRRLRLQQPPRRSGPSAPGWCRTSGTFEAPLLSLLRERKCTLSRSMPTPFPGPHQRARSRRPCFLQGRMRHRTQSTSWRLPQDRDGECRRFHIHGARPAPAHRVGRCTQRTPNPLCRPSL